MAAQNENGRGGCTIQWKIEHISHLFRNVGEELQTPTFIAEAVGGTKWSLTFYMMGDEDIFFHPREEDCVAPDEVKVSIQLAYLGKDGSILKEKTYLKELCHEIYLWEAWAKWERVFVTEREAFLPEDTLTLQCTIWNTDEKPVLTQRIFARTVLNVNEGSFNLRIDKSGFWKPNPRNIFKDKMLEFDIVLNDGKELAINIRPFDGNFKFFYLKIFIVDAKGGKEKIGKHEYFANDLLRGVQCAWFLNKCPENKIRYFPNDVLSLEYEYSCSNDTILYENCNCGMISPALANEVALYSEKQESVDSAVILNDFKFMYIDGICSDTELRTSTQTFSAHKCVLSARSPVFRKMFSHDIKENQNRAVNITDFDNDTIKRMLHYMYADSLEDLHFDGALKLYAIAEKYEIVSLKSRCSSFLKKNLCPTNASEALVLADLHQDDDLINSVQDYILQQGKAVFGTDEWLDLMNTHIKLASGIMYKKVNS